MIDWLLSLNIADIIGILGFIVATATLILTYLDKRIKLNATLAFSSSVMHITIFNNSNRTITVSYCDLFTSKNRFFSKRNEVVTSYHDDNNTIYTIQANESKTLIIEDDDDSLSGLAFKEKLYIRIWVSGKPKKIVRLTA